MIKHIIFDFGGVFLDLSGKHSGIPDDLSELFSLPYEEVAKIWDTHKAGMLTGKQSSREFLVFFAKHFQLSADLEVSQQKWERINDIPKEKIDWNLVQFVEELRKNYRVHILSDQIDVNNGIAQWKEEIEVLFHTIFRSYEEGFAKPDVEAFKNVLKKIDARAEECIFIDDSVKNVAAAKSLGIVGIVYEYGKVSELKKEIVELTRLK